MGNAAAIKGMDMAVQAAGAKLAGSQKTGQTDDGFQKLLNSKAEEDTGAKQSAGSKKEDSKEIAEEPAAKKPAAEETTEEPAETIDSTALEQVQAALLFQMTPETYVAEEAVAVTEVTEEVPEMVLEIGELPAEQPASAEVKDALPQQEQQVSALPEVQEEAIAAEPEPEKAAAPMESKEDETKPKAELEKPKDTVKPVVREEGKPEPKAEQLAENAPMPAQQTERTPAAREIPTEHVRVQQPEEVPEKLLEQLLVKTTAGIKEFEIQLEPYDLGKILIKVAFGKESANVSILCTEQKTMELMARNARDLGAIMEENLGSPTTIVVEDKEPNYLEQQNQGNNGNQGQNQEEQQKQNQQNQQNEGVDFLQQLRLGLI